MRAVGRTCASMDAPWPYTVLRTLHMPHVPGVGGSMVILASGLGLGLAVGEAKFKFIYFVRPYVSPYAK